MVSVRNQRAGKACKAADKEFCLFVFISSVDVFLPLQSSIEIKYELLDTAKLDAPATYLNSQTGRNGRAN